VPLVFFPVLEDKTSPSHGENSATVEARLREGVAIRFHDLHVRLDAYGNQSITVKGPHVPNQVRVWPSSHPAQVRLVGVTRPQLVNRLTRRKEMVLRIVR